MKKVLGLLTALVIVSSPVRASNFIHCGELHDFWTEYKKVKIGESRNWLKSGLYLGYISGWVDGDLLINTPKEATVLPHLDVVGKWLENHPEKWHEHRSDCVYWALEEAYGLKD